MPALYVCTASGRAEKAFYDNEGGELVRELYTTRWAIWRYSGARDSTETTLGTLRPHTRAD